MNRLLAIATAAPLFLLSSPASAIEPQACHGKSEIAERLACYDEATGYKAEAEGPMGEVATRESEATSSPETAETEDQGEQWRLTTERSEMDGRSDVWLRLQSENRQPNQIGSPETATLWIRCMQNKTNLLISFNSYTSDGQTVRYKFDEEIPKRIWMDNILGGDGIGVFSGGKAIPFIKEFYGKKRFIVAYNSYSNHNLEFTFDVAGLKARIAPVAESCGWKP